MFINAEEMTAVFYLSKENEVAGELNQKEDISWIAETVNGLNLVPAEFKLSDEDAANGSLVRFCNQEDDMVLNKNLFFFPGGRVMLVEGRVPYLYRIDVAEGREFFQKCDIYVEDVNKKNPGRCCGLGFWINIPDELKA